MFLSGYEPSKHKFDARLDKLTENEDMARWINAIPREKWSLAYDGGHRFGHMITNLSECMNGVLKDGRNLPITASVQIKYYKLVEYFVKQKA